MRVSGRERDLLALEFGLGDLRLSTLGFERAGYGLVFLLERELARRRAPRARDLGRHDPEVGLAVGGAVLAHLDGLVGRPIAHGKGVRDDAGPRPQVEDL